MVIGVIRVASTTTLDRDDRARVSELWTTVKAPSKKFLLDQDNP
jgi:hypothetical protein